MERLTKWNGSSNQHAYYPRCFEEPCNGGGCKIKDCPFETAVCERLAAYEDTGLTPKEIKATLTEPLFLRVAAKALGVEADRLRELAEADKAGRCVVLPCKVGDTVYTIERTFRDDAVHDEIHTGRIKGYGGNGLNKVWLVRSGDYCDFCVFPSEIGKTAFLNREEAERALEGRKNG